MEKKKMPKFSLEVLSAQVGEVVVTATYPTDTRNYWVALIGPPNSGYEVYKVLQEFTGWDAPQPIKFTDVNLPLAAGTYKLKLRERVPVAHSFNWKTWVEETVVVPEV